MEVEKLKYAQQSKIPLAQKLYAVYGQNIPPPCHPDLTPAS